jgi:hypothetical protein
MVISTTGAAMTAMMVVVISIEVVAGGLTVLPLPSSTLNVKFARSMATPLVTAGGATRMTRRIIVT